MTVYEGAIRGCAVARRLADREQLYGTGKDRRTTTAGRRGAEPGGDRINGAGRGIDRAGSGTGLGLDGRDLERQRTAGVDHGQRAVAAARNVGAVPSVVGEGSVRPRSDRNFTHRLQVAGARELGNTVSAGRDEDARTDIG